MFNNKSFHTYRSFSMSNDYSLGSLRMKTKDEKDETVRISRYELREFLQYHEKSLSYNEFSKMKKQMLDIRFSDIIDNLEDLQSQLGASRFNVSKNFGYKFVYIWFKRTRMNGLKVVGNHYFRYTFSFNDKGKLFKVDYDIK